MLPGGRLSLHGYAVKWNCFVGVCPGADHLSFEQDKALAESQLIWAERQMAAAIADAVELETCDVSDPRAWVTERDRKDIYRVTENRVVRVLELLPDVARSESGYWTRVGYTDDAGKIHGVHSNKVDKAYDAEYNAIYDDAHLRAYVRALNDHHADVTYRFRADQLKGYVGWMRGRLKGWAPKPLKERKD